MGTNAVKPQVSGATSGAWEQNHRSQVHGQQHQTFLYEKAFPAESSPHVWVCTCKIMFVNSKQRTQVKDAPGIPKGGSNKCSNLGIADGLALSFIEAQVS